MIEEPARLRIARDLQRPSPDKVAVLAGYPTGFVVDAMGGAGAMAATIAPIPGLPNKACGPALVAGNRPGDILGTLAAISFAQAGDVVVGGAQGYQGCAAAGDRVLGMLKNRGAAGFVTDGPLRDLDGLQAVGLPAWGTGLTPNSPVSHGPATLGLGIVVGGVQVAQGDVILADRDGVVVVPFAMLDAVIAALEGVAAAEHDLDAKVAAGQNEVGAIRAMLDAGGEVDWV